MSQEEPSAALKVGDIVDVRDDEGVSVGEIVSLDPLRVAVIQIRQVAPDTIEKRFDVTEFNWNELRREAKAVDVPASGTRNEIELKIKQQLKLQGALEIGLKSPAERSTTGTRSGPSGARAGDDIRENDCVLIKQTQAKGRIARITGDRCMVLVCTDNEVREQLFLLRELVRSKDSRCPDRCVSLCKETGPCDGDCWPREVKPQ